MGMGSEGVRGTGSPQAHNGDAVVGWNGESIVDAVNGTSDEWRQPDGSAWDYRAIKRYACR